VFSRAPEAQERTPPQKIFIHAQDILTLILLRHANLKIPLSSPMPIQQHNPKEKVVIEPSIDRTASLLQQGLAYHQNGLLAQAEGIYEEILKIDPTNADALHLRGIVAYQTQNHQYAVDLIRKAIELYPHNAAFFFNLGLALNELNQVREAASSYDKAIDINPDFTDAYYNRGVISEKLNQLEAALTSYDKVIDIKPDHASGYLSRGLVLHKLKQIEAAIASYDKAIAIKPDFADAYLSRGNALQELKRHEEAVASFDKAIDINPDFAEAYYNQGNALRELKQFEAASACYENALSLNPDGEFMLGMQLHTRMMLCDWTGFTENLTNYETDIANLKKVTLPFAALGLLDSPELHRLTSRIYVETKYPEHEPPAKRRGIAGSGKIRVGYYSADFYNHATAYLIAELFEVHNAEKFELFGFSFGPDIQDQMRKRLSSGLDKFMEVRDKSDREIAQLSRDLGIDIAIDLKGFTTDSRPGIFAERCAPVQVNYLGYPGTMAAEYMDYIIADTTVIPRDRQDDFTEKVVYLPHCYQVNDSRRQISSRVFTKQELGLPESGFIFCCFNNNYKILPATFDGWMRILKAVEGSVLWLLEDNSTAGRNLRKEAESRGIDSNRLVFAKRMPLDEHLARHRLAELFIDTLPCNAHTTASDALWAGLPVLTCMGKSFHSRVAASLLCAIELPELITHTQEEYEAKAVELATDPGKLAQLKLKLENNRLTAPLFNTRLFAKHIESAYETMFARNQSGLAPESIEVAD
jgi:predicted O-linked N-acetylglucosamine transferase (SPINDLY family)